MKKLSVILCAVVLVFGMTGTANAALWDRGGGLIYDEDQDITWLQDANYAGDSMNWEDAMSWADELTYYDAVRDETWTDWRLPDAGSNPQGGFNITSSEMGHLYYIGLGNTAHYGGFTNSDPFTNIQTGRYWSRTNSPPPGVGSIWLFVFSPGPSDEDGEQFTQETWRGGNAWAVMDGDVGSIIPIPGIIWLLGSGLIVFAGVKKKMYKGK